VEPAELVEAVTEARRVLRARHGRRADLYVDAFMEGYAAAVDDVRVALRAARAPRRRWRPEKYRRRQVLTVSEPGGRRIG
jgi:hypothetical protein